MGMSFAEMHPELASEFSERNLPLTVSDITYGSNKKYWWMDDSLKETISVNYTLVCCNHRNEKGSYFSINTPKDKAGTRIIPMTEKVSRAKILLGRCLLPIV